VRQRRKPTTLGWPCVNRQESVYPWGEVAQLVEHTAENRGVAGSIPALAIARSKSGALRARTTPAVEFSKGFVKTGAAGRVVC
jgi:hypothetical protein